MKTVKEFDAIYWDKEIVNEYNAKKGDVYYSTSVVSMWTMLDSDVYSFFRKINGTLSGDTTIQKTIQKCIKISNSESRFVILRKEDVTEDIKTMFKIDENNNVIEGF